VPQPWRPPPSQPTWVDNQVRIAVIADWGTGLYGAPECARSIDADSKGYDVYLHLGDVYYSGTRKEEEAFVRAWPSRARQLNLALNSNHEMYTGGDGLFNVTLPAFKQQSTCFWLQNDDFALVGLDSGYEEHDLAHDQGQWVERIQEQAQGRRLILFSHHQPFSQLDSIQGRMLQRKLGRLLDGGKIFAWYWGHEHRLAVYDRHPRWGLMGRCIGHGGMPYFRDQEPGMGGNEPRLCRVSKRTDVPAAMILDGPNPYIRSNGHRYGPNGYASLEFRGSTLVESFHLPDSTKLWVQELRRDGSVQRIHASP